MTFACCASATFAQSPAPAPSASPVAKATATAAPERTAIVTCRFATFFTWPDRSTVPAGTSYPPARFGDAFGVIGTGTLTNNSQNLTETTIDVVQPYGAGKHYWIATACVT